jgi:ribonuclease BN (tRNA processing enzyme)
MKLTILGASGAFPLASTATSGYLLEIDGHHILIDCGSGVLSRLQEHIRLDQLEAIILTHLHADHTSDLGVLKYAMDLTRKYHGPIGPIPLYAPSTPEPLAAALASPGNLELHTIRDGQSFTLFGATIQCLLMAHPVETLGLRISKDGKVLATTADTIPCANLQPLLHEADLAMMDSALLERLRTPAMVHLTAAECGQIATENAVRQLLLIHLLPFYDPAEALAEARSYCPTTEIAQPGYSYEI